MTATLVDRTAWRGAFAEPGEKLVLVLGTEGLSAEGVLDKLGSARVLLYGSRTRREGVHHLEPWSSSLLPAIEEIADLVLRLPVGDEVIAKALGQAPPTEIVLYNEWGIGDELLLSAVAREIVRAYPSHGVWIRSRHGFHFPEFVRRGEPPASARRVEAIYQNPTMYGPDRHAPFPGHLVQQMLDKVFVDTGLLVKAENVRPALDGSRHARPARPRVLVHSKGNPRLPSKEWGVERWAKLCRLLKARGVDVVQAGAADEPILPGVEDRRGTPVGALQELVTGSSLVVCLVGFFMHLAAAVGTPAVVIYGGREHPSIDGYPDQVHLSSGALECRGRWGCHLAPDLPCPHGMRCMDGLSPELVAEEVFELL